MKGAIPSPTASLRKRVAIKSQRLLSSIRYAFFGHFFLWLTGCYYLPKAVGPMRVVFDYWTPGQRQQRLIVYLPGRSDRPEDFREQGLWQSLRDRNLPCDVAALDAHLGHYLKMSIVERVMKDVIEPARAQGYEEIWVVGNSLGGLGALLVEKSYSKTWDRMILLAPFLGDDKNLYRNFDASGGIRNWNPGVTFARTDFSPRLWLWLKDWPEEAERRPPISVGYGESDRLRLGIEYLAPLIGEENVERIPGGHKWDVWKPLWDRILDTSGISAAEGSRRQPPQS